MGTPLPGSGRPDRRTALTLRNWGDRPVGPGVGQLDADVAVDCGWGRLLFAHTFHDNEKLVDLLRNEAPGKRDIAFYVRDPHVLLSLAPQEVFLDPSHTYRLWLSDYRPSPMRPRGFTVRRIQTEADAEAINRIYASRDMVKVDPPTFIWKHRTSKVLTFYVAEDINSGTVIGTVTGVDHANAFNDPENGSSLWCLAVDPQAEHPGIGQALTTHLAEHYLARGRAFMDLSVMHDNRQAIALYEKLGFQRVPAFCVKHKNPINERLFVGPHAQVDLNPYAMIIVNEARRRGIAVDVIDDQMALFALSYGGRTIRCRESLSELTTSVAMTICDDKALTHRLLGGAGLAVPEQETYTSGADARRFLERHGRIVVKPARGEQGAGVSAGVETPDELDAAVQKAERICDRVLLERFAEGEDLRVIVIDGRVVAAAVRRPAQVTGTGRHTVTELIDKQSRRRAAATGGESTIPVDEETERVIRRAGYELDSVLEAGTPLVVRRTANLHTGGTIHDVTARLHDELRRVSEKAAQVLAIPVMGLDLLVPDVSGDEYVILEANERPGLANHEPQPTAERFIDLLFPQTAGLR